MIVCGTRSGYNKHKKENSPVCSLCKDAQNEYDRQRYALNPSYFKEKNNRNLNKEKKLARWRKREALRLGNSHSPYSFAEVIEKYGAICHICKKEIDLNLPRKCGENGWEMGIHLDHVIPISKGGNDSLNNIRPSHAICNLKKGNRLRCAGTF